MKDLIKILERFEANRKDFKTAEDVAKCFEEHCAKDILCNGYFEITWKEKEKEEPEKRIIDIGAIELYYHEEGKDAKIKDPIMYHTNDKSSYSKFFDKNKGFPYFKLGSFNLHSSGVDVTFENEENKYRASFLIRSYRVLNKKEELWSQVPRFDGCSTHIFDDMFPKGMFFKCDNEYSIEWKTLTTPKAQLDDPQLRINVAEYKFVRERENGTFVYEKVPIEIGEIFDENKHLKSDGKYFKRDQRLWHFRRKE